MPQLIIVEPLCIDVGQQKPLMATTNDVEGCDYTIYVKDNYGIFNYPTESERIKVKRLFE